MRALLREPLVQFLVAGGLLFALYAWNGGGSGSSAVRVRAAEVERLRADFARTWQRAPTEAELKGLVEDRVREELAVREALALGLDRDDGVIRRQLRQKLELLAEDAAEAAPPTDAELQAWLAAHPDDFRSEARVALRQVYLNPDKRPDAAGDARRLLARLQRAGLRAPLDDLGDPLMLPRELPLSPRSDVARLFGAAFADRVVALEPGSWTGPVESGLGWHLVLVLAREPARLPELPAVLPAVERALANDRRRRRVEALYERLRARSTVVVETPGALPGAVR